MEKGKRPKIVKTPVHGIPIGEAIKNLANVCQADF